MSRALKCDICGAYFDYNSKYIGIFINRYNRYDTRVEIKEEPLLEFTDMCPDCYNAIMETIDDRRKVHHTENEAEEDND